jgi:RNA polymerase sigma-70 factor (ECF subfamily)
LGDKLKINHSLKAYLYTAVKRNVISFYFRQLTKETVSIEAVHEELPGQHTTQQHLDYTYTLSLYNQSLHELPEKCREVFVLSRNGYSLKEIANIKNISPKTAEVHIGKALQYLRQKLKGSSNLLLLILSFVVK